MIETNKAIMAASIALVMVAVAFVCIGEPRQVEAITTDGTLEEGDIVEMGARDLYVVLATKQYDDGDFGGYNGIYVVSNGAESIRQDAFRGCESIRTVYISSNVSGIGTGAFMDMPNLSYVYGPGIKHIDASAFENSGLGSCYFNSNLSVIGDGAFRNCVNFNNFDFHKTSVTSLGSEVFANSGIQLLDIRKVTHIEPDAFTGSRLTMQLVTSDQECTVQDVDRLVYDGGDPDFGHVRCVDGNVIIESDRLMFFDVTDSDGDDVDHTVRKITAYVEYWTEFSVDEGKDYYVDGRGLVIDYPDDIGLDDVELEDETSYTLPTDVDLGDLDFEGWEIEGLEGTYTEIDRDTAMQMGGTIVLKPVFGYAVLKMDHSGISGLTDVGKLPTSTLFTYGDVYPSLDAEVVGYTFAGWTVDGKDYGAGDRIEKFTAHTAVSRWVPSEMLVLTYGDGAGGSVKTTEHAYGTEAVLDDEVVAPEAASETFLGWSLDGTTVLEDGHVFVMRDDVTLAPVFGARDEVTVTYVTGDGSSEVKGYEGRTFTVTEDVPVSETAFFVQWMDDDGNLYDPGDEFTLYADVTLTAQWRDAVFHQVVYMSQGEEVHRQSVREDRTATVGADPGEYPGHEFLGWSTADDGTMDYTDGQTIALTDDIVLFAVWKEIEAVPPSTGGDDDEPEEPQEPSDPSGSDDQDDPSDDGQGPGSPGAGVPGTGGGGTSNPGEGDDDDQGGTSPVDPGTGQGGTGTSPGSEDQTQTDDGTGAGGSESTSEGSGGGISTNAAVVAAVGVVAAVTAILAVMMRRS